MNAFSARLANDLTARPYQTIAQGSQKWRQALKMRTLQKLIAELRGGWAVHHREHFGQVQARDILPGFLSGPLRLPEILAIADHQERAFALAGMSMHLHAKTLARRQSIGD